MQKHYPLCQDSGERSRALGSSRFIFCPNYNFRYPYCLGIYVFLAMLVPCFSDFDIKYLFYAWEAYSNRTVRGSVPLCVWGISPIFYEAGIPNLVCACILRLGSVAYHPWATVTLTSDQVSRIGIESGAYLLYSLR